ncbi:hypothetical protein EJ02DRAFT_224585 [Clathrospora elynae]|uniref:Heterokaryon incompatibility domain-containing protein n=1 Tax=Clathrospora elynae TaxID=706981 RepID=A0A6A5SMG9_9PLEO|nr:hypothetical protein EJ02DRAFT_224585 [Clathrospora elynae]
MDESGQPRYHQPSEVNARLSIQLTAIDCATRSLVALPDGAPYVTLSYVWGFHAAEPVKTRSQQYAARLRKALRNTISRSTADDTSTFLLLLLPRTIEDSIFVCKSLDFQYLWIDRYLYRCFS